MPTPESIARIVDGIRAGQYTKEEMLNLRENATRLNNQVILKELEQRLRSDFPGVASKLYGRKEQYAITLLEEVHADLEREFDLSGNRVKVGVKTGGEMLNGNKHIDVYISYKNQSGTGIALALIQDAHDTELKPKLERYQLEGEKSREIQMFSIDDFPHAVKLYREYLQQLIA